MNMKRVHQIQTKKLRRKVLSVSSVVEFLPLWIKISYIFDQTLIYSRGNLLPFIDLWFHNSPKVAIILEYKMIQKLKLSKNRFIWKTNIFSWKSFTERFVLHWKIVFESQVLSIFKIPALCFFLPIHKLQ